MKPLRAILIAGLVLSAAVLAQEPEPIGEQFQVNTYTTGYQFSTEVAAASTSGFVVVWTSYGADGTDTSFQSVQAQRYHPNGATAGGQFQVNSYTLGTQGLPAVAVGSNGGFVVVWTSDGPASTDPFGTSIQGQLFDSSGATDGDQFQVNSYTTSSQGVPAVATDSNGNLVVVWVSVGSSGTDSDGTSIQGQLFDSSGATVGGEFQINSYTTSFQRFPAVATDSSGNFVVVWESLGSYGTDSSSYSIQGQLYDAAGAAVGDEFQVNSFTTSHQRYPAVATGSGGKFVVVWESLGSYGPAYFKSIQGQRYDLSGNPLGDQFQVNTYTGNDKLAPAVAADPLGDFVVVWGSLVQDGSVQGVFGQRFDNGGVPQGGEFAVNTYTTNHQGYPSVATSRSSKFVVVWESEGSYGSDSSGYSIQGQRFSTKLIFSDAFETGDTSSWSSTVQ